MTTTTAKSPAQAPIRYEVITQEANDGSGDMIVPLPVPVLKQLGWKEGDEVEIDIDDEGQMFLRKIFK